MAFDEALAERLRNALAGRDGVTEKRMFGGLGVLLNGNMLVGIAGDRLIVRLGPDAHAAALARPHVGEFDITGRPMKGWVMVSPDGTDTDAELQAWLDQALAFAATLPPK